MDVNFSKNALIIGGTKGLGFSLASAALTLGIKSTILGRTVLNSQILPTGLNSIHFDLLEDNWYNTLPFDPHQDDYIVWVAGIFLKKPLIETTHFEFDSMINLHFRAPVFLIKEILKERYKNTLKPMHLVVIASCSSWKLREFESVYTAIKAAQAAFARNIVPELLTQLPQSKVTLIQPGGLNTPNFHKSYPIESGIFLEPDVVAKIIWEKVVEQKEIFSEWQILQDKKMPNPVSPIVQKGPCLPEIYV